MTLGFEGVQDVVYFGKKTLQVRCNIEGENGHSGMKGENGHMGWQQLVGSIKL